MQPNRQTRFFFINETASPIRTKIFRCARQSYQTTDMYYYWKVCFHFVLPYPNYCYLKKMRDRSSVHKVEVPTQEKAQIGYFLRHLKQKKRFDSVKEKSVIFYSQIRAPSNPTRDILQQRRHFQDRPTTEDGTERIFKRGYFWIFFVRYSTRLHLPPLRLYCVGESWDRTQDSCDYDIGCQTL
jgi:hypothetical protein